MMDYIIAIFSFVVVIGILTTVHEAGHFLVARLCGVKVLQFSIGFGKSLLSWHDRFGTEYMISAIPLGGYVRMLGDDDNEVTQLEQHMAFSGKSVFARMAIICAGPFANMIFAVIAYWLVFMIGISSIVPVLGTVPKGTVADLANLKKGYEIVSIDEQRTNTWEDVSVALMPHLGEKSFVKLKAYNKVTKKQSIHVINLTDWTVDNTQGDILKSLGLEPFDPVLPVIGKLISGCPVADSGLQPGDQIIALDDVPVETRTQVTNYVRKKAGIAINVTAIRQGKKLTFWVTPMKKLAEGGEEIGFIGIQYQQTPWPKELITVHKFGPVDSFKKALIRTKEYTVLTLQFLQKIIMGKISLQYVAGPISIAKYAGQTACIGVEYFLGFLALVSINLGILNLVLPIPILDGGHILYCVLELLNGKALSKRAVEVGRIFGVIFLASLMLLALYNDILRL